MSFEIFFQKNKDEMDFIPIIPLNESDGESMDGTDIPDEISCYLFEIRFFFPAWFCR